MLSCPKSVRIAVEGDAEELFGFAWQANEEMRYARKDAERVRSTIDRAVSVRRNPVIGVIRRKQGIEAAIGLSFAEPWLSVSPVVTNFLFYVHPEFRRSLNAEDLVSFGAWFAHTIEMPLILIDWSGGESGKSRLFGRRGQQIGAVFAVGAEAA